MDKSELKIGIIGAGRWGKNHVRTANSLLQPEQIVVSDFDDSKSSIVNEINEKIVFTTDIDQVLNDPAISGVIIASPAETHYKLTLQALIAGKNVLVEKPIALDVEEAEELVKVAE